MQDGARRTMRPAGRGLRRGLGSVALALLTAGLAACGTPGGAEDDTTTAAGTTQAAPAQTGITTTEPVTLAVSDAEAEGSDKTLRELNAAFQKKYPNVTVKRTTRPFNDYMPTIKLAMSSANAPDVAMGNQGWSMDGPLVQGKLIRPIEEYADAYGWKTRFGSEDILDQLRFSEDGKSFGEGTLWGVSQKAEMLGVYYNKTRLRQLGLEEPKTFAEFEASLAAARKANVTPIMLGNLDKWPGGHLFMVLNGAHADKENVRNWVYGREGASLDTEESRQAAAKAAEWAKAGYFERGFNGVGDDDASARFAKGESLYIITGTWRNADYFDALKDQVGFFLLPPVEGEGPVTTGSLSLPFHLSSKSENPEVGAAYLDYITGPEAAKVMLKNGDIPATPLDASEAGGNVVLGSILDQWKAVGEADGLNPYMDWTAPTMGDVLFSGFQQVLDGKQAPAAFTKAVQAEWEKARQSRQ